jgi:outer membrane protein OmpA-like peptidoglycan-associated protein
MHARALLVALALLAVVTPARADAADDDRLVLVAPNSLGQAGLVRTTSALIDDTGTAWLGLSGRVFATPDFVVDGTTDAATFLEGQGSLGLALFRVLELSLQTRAGGVLSSARTQPTTSLGDATLGLKGGWNFGLVAVGATARLGLPSRAAKVGFDLGNVAAAGAGLVSIDLLEIGLPVRLHLNGGYQLQPGRLAADNTANNPYFLDGEDGALIAMAAQQWFFDSVHAGLGVEVPLPYLTPFVEVWYQAALGADDYAFFGDAWLTLTPGLRLGVGGLRVDLALDVGLSGTGGGLAIDPAQLTAGQPVNPLWAGRVAVAHAFDLFGGGGGGGRFARLEGCATANGQPVVGAVAVVAIDGQPGPRLAADAAGCFSAPVQAGALAVTVTAPQHSSVVVNVAAAAGSTVRADAALLAAPARARLKGFITNKDDEAIEAALTIVDAAGTRDVGASVGGAFDLDVAAGPVTLIARAPGSLALGHTVVLAADDRRSLTLQLRKEPKKRSVTLGADRVELTGRVPYVFKSERLQSTAGYLLDEIADLLLTNPGLRLSIEAHTDPSEVEDASAAKALTEGRAAVLKDALVELGVDAARLETSGYGITQLVGPPNDPKNRRVELVIVK